MNTKDISQAKDPDLRSSLTALRRASAVARREAIRADVDFVIVEDGKLILIEAKQLREPSRAEVAANS